jgi:hypothetical protein
LRNPSLLGSRSCGITAKIFTDWRCKQPVEVRWLR